MDDKDTLQKFQEVLDRVAENGIREEVNAVSVPDVLAWHHLDGKGCTISVEAGRWWVVPPQGDSFTRTAA